MPRQARIDAPCAYHHIICRGIERRRIFRDDADRCQFIFRLGNLLQRTGTRCFAWALIPNHFHLLLQTGTAPIATVMERLLTGYAGYYNRRYKRHGHLFQNRYKSILCQEDPYFLELVRYIHLNPLRAGLVTTLRELIEFPYCGHATLLGAESVRWQSISEVLLRFDSELKPAQDKYREFVAAGKDQGRRPELCGGGLLRSVGGWQPILMARRFGEHLKSDERILGDSDFVEEVISAAKEKKESVNVYRMNGLGIDWVAQSVAELMGLDISVLQNGGKRPTAVQARSLVCHWATAELRLTSTAVAKWLQITQSAVTKAVPRGEKLAKERGWHLKVPS